MILAIQKHYILPPSVPTAVVILMAVAGVVAWVGLHRLKRRAAGRQMQIALMAAGALVGFLALLAVAQVLLRVIVLATNWSIWPVALLGALAVEVILGLFDLERRTVSRGKALALGVLRVGLVVLVILMLTQPVWQWEKERREERFVAVLVDASASMDVPDTQMTPDEKVALANLLGAAGPDGMDRLDKVATQLRQVRELLATQAEWLASLAQADPSTRAAKLADHRETLQTMLREAAAAVEQQTAALAAATTGSVTLKPETAAAVANLKKRLTDDVQGRLTKAVQTLTQPNDQALAGAYDSLQKAVGGAAAALAEVLPAVDDVTRALDELLYAALSPEDRARVDTVATRTRADLARDLLLGASVKAPGSRAAEPLLSALAGKYTVALYTFASKPTKVDREAYARSAAPGESPAAPNAAASPAEEPASAEQAATLLDEHLQTNIAAALEKVTTDLAGLDLAGVVLVSDGRHNTASPVEPLAKQLGLQHAPVCPIVMGSRNPPIDASILALEAPDTVTTKDKVLVAAEVKLDGLAGHDAKVTLWDGDKAVDSKDIRVAVDSLRTRVELADQPGTAGLHAYRVEIAPLPKEVLTTNNSFPATVSVTDDRTKLLLVEGWPRWEFRYIKNLFETRDSSVKLQYVLFRPDRIAEVPSRPAMSASATRPPELSQATALPENQEEWNKFDVIILGDVAPSMLPAEAQEAITQFVTQRGGTLVVVSGPKFMPHHYGNTPLAEILPVRCDASDSLFLASPERVFRIGLTVEGQAHTILREKVDPTENVQVWQSFPPIFWRHAVTATKPGATVLAYAVPIPPPDFLKPAASEAGGNAPKDGDEATLRRREAFERENPLLALHNVAAGRVLFLGFDSTWRLRYGVGDTYHHRLWGQILRWATANKLPAGTDFVRIGTDRTRYPTGQPVQVRAKILRIDYSPVQSDTVAVKILSPDGKTLRHPLKYIESSNGMYEAEVKGLPGGTYRVELDAPAAQPMLASEGLQTVWTQFSVDPAFLVETAELAPDRGLMSQLAALSQGIVAEPADAARVLDALGPGTVVEYERHEYVLWNSWPLWLAMILLASAEWILRKKVGLT
ncbi:MAG: hypothetical protein WBE00_00320 [Phycisphaerae bacterium]